MSEENCDFSTYHTTYSEEKWGDNSAELDNRVHTKVSTPKPEWGQTIKSVPWSVLILGVLRVLFQLVSLSQSSSPLIVKADGSTALSHIVRTNKFLKYPYVPHKVPVLSIVLSPYSLDAALSLISAIGMIVAALTVVGLGGKLAATKLRPKYAKTFFVLYTVCLLVVTKNLAYSLAAILTHSHLLCINVGILEGVALLLVSLALNLFQWMLWYGALEFQKGLLLRA